MTSVDQFTLGISNAFFLKGDQVVLVDTGSEGGAEAFQRVCEEHGVKPSEITLIVITHGHADHFINASEIKELTGAPILCHKAAQDILREGREPFIVPRNDLGRRVYEDTMRNPPTGSIPPVEADILIDEPCSLRAYGVDARIILTPGHSDCSLSVLLDTGEAIVGDLVLADHFSKKLALAWFANDEKKLFDSIETVLDGATIIYSGHGGPYSSEEVRALLRREQGEVVDLGSTPGP